MPDETLARSRQKGKEKKEMKYCRKTVLADEKQAKHCRNKRGYVQAKGRLQCWNADGQELGASGEGFKGFKGFKGLKAGKRQARMP